MARSVWVGAVLVALAGCGGGSAEPTASTTGPATTTTTVTGTTAPGPTTTAAEPAATTTVSAEPCQGIDVENPGVVAVSAADGSPCWSALSGWNAYATAEDGGRVVIVGGPCPGAQSTLTMAVVDAATGQELWRHEPARGPGEDGSDPRQRLGTGAGVVVAPSTGNVEALDLTSGGVLWRVDGQTPLADGPDTVVTLQGEPGGLTLAVLERTTGQQRWSKELALDYVAVTADANAVLVSSDGATKVYDARTGELLADLPIGPASDTFAVRVVDGVATGTTGIEPDPNATRAFDAVTGAPLWTNPGYPPQRPEPTDGNVYVAVDAGVAALDPRTGEIRWTVEGANLEAGPGLALAMVGDATVEAVEPATGEVRWSRALDELGLPSPDTVLPSGFTPSLQNVLPTASGVFFAYGNCVGN